MDGVYVKAGFEKEKSAVLVVLGALSNGRKVVLGISSGYRESTESWSTVMSTKSFSGDFFRLFPNTLFNHGIWMIHGGIVVAAIIVAVIVL